MSMKTISSSVGHVQGPHSQEILVCQFTNMTNARGCTWLGGNPFAFTLPAILSQFIVISAITSGIWFLLRPLKQSLLSAQLIGGIIMGRSFLGQIRSYGETLFPPGGRLTLETFADMGFMFYLFILGVHVDVSLIKKVERNAVVIGVVCFAVPLTTGLAVAFTLPKLIETETSFKESLPLIATVNSMSSFPVITSLLTDLNILNSEIGRIATLASLVSDICNYITSVTFVSILLGLTSDRMNAVFTVLWAVLLFLVIIFGLRPMIVLIARRAEGQQMDESQFIAIVLIVMLCGLAAEMIGQPGSFATFILGVVIPDGPPLGSSFVYKLDTVVTRLLVPAKFVINGLSMDLLSIRGVSGAVCGLLLLASYVAKFTATLIPALHYRIPVRNAIALALVMSCKGVVEAALYITLQEDGIINDETYAIMLTSMLIVTGVARPLIWRLYDPSSRYVGQRKNTILGNHPNDELRVLACIHGEENVPSIINLLDASTSMSNRPLAVFVLNLMDLKGRGASVLELTTTRHSKLTSTKSWCKHISNAFNLFEQKNQGAVFVRHFTSISPYASMHDDICTLGLDQNANIVIVPFHKQWTIDGRVGSNSPSIRMVNKNVLTKSPCTVGVLVDRGSISRSHSMLQISLLFLGGADDCEALALCSRFVDNPQISLTFVWVRPWDDKEFREEMEGSIDKEMVKQFRANTIRNERIIYREEFVGDAIGTTRVIRSVEDGYDLLVVGRYHDPGSPLVHGLTDWSECPELGFIGDMLATSDFQFSVLVVQQQPQGTESNDSHPLQSIACGCSSAVCYGDYQDPYSYSFHQSVSHSKRT